MKKLFKFLWLFLGIVVFSSFVQEQCVQAGENLKIVVQKKVSVKLTDYKKVKVKVYYNGKDVTKEAKLSFKSSNKSIVRISKLENDDFDVIGFEAWPRKTGNSNVSIVAKYRPSHWDDEDYDDEDYDDEDYNDNNSEAPMITATKKCKVKAEYYKTLRADADLVDYNTRTNIFTMKVYNISNKTIKILSNGAMAYDEDYTVYDRKLKVIKGSTIKPGKTVMVKFKVIGSITWHDSEDFQICSYWKWGGKKYWVSVIPGEETWKKVGKKWKWIGFAG
ncbi:hypothetical protein [Intestinibacter sp.]|uniref:hypothetical protein n=1 Tax=Intestinibacter sp. TaxID=1965304 RepID=UPI002A913930|nr:hypothetical protein [Intestinibacter sp.]MDY5213142.1 hypothetical protein [Intestinibacter sp.]